MAVRVFSSIAKALLKQTGGLGSHLVSYVLTPIFLGTIPCLQKRWSILPNAWEAAPGSHYRITHLPSWLGQQELTWSSNLEIP